MNSMQSVLAEMNARLDGVEGGLVQLRDEGRESKGRQEAILTEMQHQAEALKREVARHTAQVDQVSAYLIDNVKHYQGNAGKIMGMIIEKDAELAARHEALVRRVDDIERRLAG